jgi:hypothetical protein
MSEDRALALLSEAAVEAERQCPRQQVVAAVAEVRR